MADIEISHFNHRGFIAHGDSLGVVAGTHALVDQGSTQCLNRLAVGLATNGIGVLFIVGDGTERPVGAVFRFARMGNFSFYLQRLAHRLDFLLDSVCGAAFAKCL